MVISGYCILCNLEPFASGVVPFGRSYERDCRNVKEDLCFRFYGGGTGGVSPYMKDTEFHVKSSDELVR